MANNTIEIRLVGTTGQPASPTPPAPVGAGSPPSPTGAGSPAPPPAPKQTATTTPQAPPSPVGPPANAQNPGAPPLPFDKPQATPIGGLSPKPTPQPQPSPAGGKPTPSPSVPPSPVGGKPPKTAEEYRQDYLDQQAERKRREAALKPILDQQKEQDYADGKRSKIVDAMSEWQQKLSAKTNEIAGSFAKLAPAILAVTAAAHLFRTVLSVINQDIALRHQADIQGIQGNQLEADYAQSQRGYKAVAGVARVVPLIGEAIGGMIEGIGDLFTAGQKRFIERMEAFDRVIDRQSRYSPEVARERAISQTQQFKNNIEEARYLGPKTAELERAKRELEMAQHLRTMAENSYKLIDQIKETKEKAQEQIDAIRLQIGIMRLLGKDVSELQRLVDEFEKKRKSEDIGNAFEEVMRAGGFSTLPDNRNKPDSGGGQLNVPLLDRSR